MRCPNCKAISEPQKLNAPRSTGSVFSLHLRARIRRSKIPPPNATKRKIEWAARTPPSRQTPERAEERQRSARRPRRAGTAERRVGTRTTEEELAVQSTSLKSRRPPIGARAGTGTPNRGREPENGEVANDNETASAERLRGDLGHLAPRAQYKVGLRCPFTHMRELNLKRVRFPVLYIMTSMHVVQSYINIIS